MRREKRFHILWLSREKLPSHIQESPFFGVSFFVALLLIVNSRGKRFHFFLALLAKFFVELALGETKKVAKISKNSLGALPYSGNLASGARPKWFRKCIKCRKFVLLAQI